MLSNGGLKSQSVGKRKILTLLRLIFSRETNKVFTLHINESTEILQKKINRRSLKNIIVRMLINYIFGLTFDFAVMSLDAKNGQISKLKGMHENRKNVTVSNFLSVSLT